MKQLSTYINEKLVLNKGTFKVKYFPKTFKELRELVEQLIKERGKDADLNDIDVSDIDKMGSPIRGASTQYFGLFEGLDPHNIDISKWNVSNVTDMNYMFYNCKNFNCDLSEWDVSKVNDMLYMFCNCKNFNCDLSKWDVSKVNDMSYMFWECENFNCNLSSWDVSKAEYMQGMFEDCINFKGYGLENWNLKNAKNTRNMFYGCSSLNCDLSNWDISNIPQKQFMFQKSSLKAKYKPKK